MADKFYVTVMHSLTYETYDEFVERVREYQRGRIITSESWLQTPESTEYMCMMIVKKAAS